MTIAPAALAIEQLSKSLANRKVLSAVSLSIASATSLVLLGPNGSGKSTLIRCCSGLLVPDQGRVLIAGHDMISAPMAAKKALGFAPDPQLLPGSLTMRQTLEVAAHARQIKIDQQSFALLEELGASHWLDSYVANLSLGTKQKLAIALALIAPCAVLILDEVFNGLDPLSAHRLKGVLKHLVSQQGSALLISTHDLHVASDLADQIALLQDGHIAANWSGQALQAIKQTGVNGLEAAVIAGMQSPNVK